MCWVYENKPCQCTKTATFLNSKISQVFYRTGRLVIFEYPTIYMDWSRNKQYHFISDLYEVFVA